MNPFPPWAPMGAASTPTTVIVDLHTVHFVLQAYSRRSQLQ